jgi:hypothetical protein
MTTTMPDLPADLAAELAAQTAALVRLRRLAIETLLDGQTGGYDGTGVLYDRRMRWAVDILKVTGGVAVGADPAASPRRRTRPAAAAPPPTTNDRER